MTYSNCHAALWNICKMNQRQVEIDLIENEGFTFIVFYLQKNDI